MKFKIPFTFSSLNRLKKRAGFFSSRVKYRKKSKISEYLKNSGVKVTREEYMGICEKNFFIALGILFVVSTTLLAVLSVRFFYLYGFLLALVFSGFVFFSQMSYPKVYVLRKQRELDKNLLPAMQDMLIQMNSGIPLFNILVNISYSEYGALSEEFKEAVKEISAGEPQEDVLKDMAEKSASVFVRRTLWQLSNGLRAGSDMAIVIKDSLKSLNEEQIIQIQNYGNKLNPLIVFYMLISVIIPALSITFLTILSSMVNLPGIMTILLFLGLFVFVVLIQIMFLGVIKSRRPSLL